MNIGGDKVKSYAGVGRIHLSLHSNEAVFAELSYCYPLKLLSPRVLGSRSAIAYMLTYGGGLISGDSVNLSIEVDAGASLLLLTQGSTKVFKQRPGTRLSHGKLSLPKTKDIYGSIATVQKLDARVKCNGLLLLLPDPITCFSSASFTQHQIFHLEPGASAIVLDWITSGRIARGEEWDFDRYRSTNEIWIGEKRLIRDALLLEKNNGSNRAMKDRMRSYSCYATLFLVGPRVTPILTKLTSSYDGISIFQQSQPPGILWSLSRAADGCVVRVAGDETEQVKLWIKHSLQDLESDVGTEVLSKALL